MKSLINTFMTLALTGVFFSCGGTQSERLCTELAKSQCDFAYDCCNAAERGAFNIAGSLEHSSKGECIDSITRATCSQLAPFADAEEQERLLANAEAVDAYLAEARESANTCDARFFFAPAEGVPALYSGQVSDGDDCFNANECASAGSACVQNDDPNLITVLGYCDAPPAVGEACPDNLCAPGARCEEAVCVARLGVGEVCTDITQCQEELACSFDEERVCITLRTGGAPCANNTECASSRCNEQEVCEAVVLEDEINYEICLAAE